MNPNPTYAPFDTVEDAVLAAVGRLHYLTNTQLCQRFWRPTSLTAMRAVTKELADHDYLTRVLVRRAARAGSAPLVFTLGPAGRRRLRRLGVTPGRFRPGEVVEKSELFVHHTLALNDVLLSAERLSVASGVAHLAGLRHERDLRRTPLRSLYGPVIPDAWLEFHVADGGHQVRDCFLVELDRGTEGVRAVRQKIARLVTLDMDAYAALVGTSSFNGFLVVTTSGARRQALLSHWIADELALQRRSPLAELFYITALSAAECSPETFFLGCHWSQPGQPLPTRLFASGSSRHR